MNSNVTTKHSGRTWVVAGCLIAGLAVGLGALGAHFIESYFEKYTDDPVRRLELWETAVRYQMYHALALIALGLTPLIRPRTRRIIGGMFVVGIVLFSGCLIAYTVTDVKPLVHIVPMGGITLIVSWIVFAISVATFRGNQADSQEQP